MIGEDEELDTAGTNQRTADEDGPSQQLRKRKKLFGRGEEKKHTKKKQASV